ncbi:putative hexokinase-1 protein [Phaeoacremonium minimum UCRPA7]|uniref:Phosphotransferase n=1 Tax=Phaeoacremonium minimum (strain UCR-PA7) TaxID=1286976 RepID=R8BXK3_PHAM7|nr:putative hexokinase-1 protein [Phaeoacremonium minimum UCRPA7]EOO04078.1 putative hexokinase-1 protein [Phaeoacremonium minimum UCRPA7]
MLPSFIDRAPSGKEEGSVIALDIGGSTMRVALIKLNPTANSVADRLKVERKQQWLIEQCVKELYADRFFDWIAQNVKTFFENQGMTIDGELSSIPLGLVWSFPLDQKMLNDGELKDMGKGFRVGLDLKGKSINACLSAAFERLVRLARMQLRFS